LAAVPPILEVREAFELAAAYNRPDGDRFYGPIGDAAIGAGLVLTNVEYPTYLRDEEGFGRLKGAVLVLTHECDLDQENERVLNDVALVCPIIPLDALVGRLNEALDYETARRLIANISARYVNRLLYLPLIPNELPWGGYLYLNHLTNTHLSKLTADDVKAICMLSRYGLRELDFALERHLLRPKVDRVPFQVEAGDGA
jgi:hypothetical protein